MVMIFVIHSAKITATIRMEARMLGYMKVSSKENLRFAIFEATDEEIVEAKAAILYPTLRWLQYGMNQSPVIFLAKQLPTIARVSGDLKLIWMKRRHDTRLELLTAPCEEFDERADLALPFHRLSTIQEADKLVPKMAKSSSKEITNLLADKGFTKSFNTFQIKAE